MPTSNIETVIEDPPIAPPNRFGLCHAPHLPRRDVSHRPRPRRLRRHDLCGLPNFKDLNISGGEDVSSVEIEGALLWRPALHSAEKSLLENPNIPGAYRVRAACLSQLDQVDEAKAALADFLRLAPSATVASTKAQVPLKKPEDLDRYIRALKRAGLPDS